MEMETKETTTSPGMVGASDGESKLRRRKVTFKDQQGQQVEVDSKGGSEAGLEPKITAESRNPELESGNKTKEKNLEGEKATEAEVPPVPTVCVCPTPKKLLLDPDEAKYYDEYEFAPGCARLCTIDEMPPHLQFNQYIHTGYRRLQDVWGCVVSVLYLHNETLNILTHLAPLIYVMFYWHTLFPWDAVKGNLFLSILGWSHIVASTAPWIGSVFYHVMMSHHSGPTFYSVLLQIDIFGIWLTECLGGVTNLTAVAWCLPDSMKNWAMAVYGAAAIFGLQKALTAWTPVTRRMCFAPVFIARVLGIALRLSEWGGGDASVLSHVLLQDVFAVGGGIIGGIRIPEKWFPGRLDFWFNSHHIMHVMAIIAFYHMNLGTNGDIRWILKNYNGCMPS